MTCTNDHGSAERRDNAAGEGVAMTVNEVSGRDHARQGRSPRAWAARSSRRSSLALILAIYVPAVAVCLLVAALIGTENGWWCVAGGYVASTALLYVASQIVGNGSTFDAWWSVMPSAIAVWLLFTVDAPSDGGLASVARPVVVVLVVVWGIRLTANWALSWPGLGHEDWRYVQLYERVPLPRWLVSLLTVHLFPTAAVAIASLPLVAVLTRDDIDGWPLLATVVAVAGVLKTSGSIYIEHRADVELRAFNRTKQPGDIIDTGWWSRSRHPNYLGEMGFWWGQVLVAIALDLGAWWTLIGPLVITVMFFTASIPIIETRSAERRPNWSEYAARTPMVIPRPRPRARR